MRARLSVRVWLSAALLAACTREVTRYFIPSTRNPHFAPAEAEREIGPFVGLRCAQQGDSALSHRTGDARLRLDVGHDGRVTRAELSRGTGDSMLDGVVGAVVAQLALPVPTKPSEQQRTAQVHYDCGRPDGRLVALTVAP